MAIVQFDCPVCDNTFMLLPKETDLLPAVPLTKTIEFEINYYCPKCHVEYDRIIIQLQPTPVYKRFEGKP